LKQTISKQLIKEWNNHIKWLKESTIEKENPIEKDKRIELALKDYQFFVKTYFSHYVTYNDSFIPNAKFHNEVAYKLMNEDNIFMGAKWSRGFGKSTHISLFIPLWLIFNKKINHILFVSKTRDDSIRLLQHIQSELEYNQLLIHDFSNGSFITSGDWSKSSIVLNNYDVAVNVIGRGQDPRGIRYKQYRIDYLIIDDLDDHQLVMNPERVQETFNWLKESLLSTVNIKKFRCIFVENLYAKNSVFYKYITEFKNIFLSEINALNDNNESSWPERFTTQELLRIKENIGSISFNREYMNNPIIEGSVFKSEYFKYSNIEITNNDLIVMYFDPSFKDRGDYKSVAVMTRRGDKLYLIDMYLRKSSVDSVFYWIYDTYEKYHNMGCAVYCYMEANFAQDIIYTNIQTVSDEKGYRLPIIFDKNSKANKYSRIELSSVWFERGLFNISNEIENNMDTKKLIEQYLMFGEGSSANDDGPDSVQSAIEYVIKNTRVVNSKPIFDFNTENIKY